MAVDDCQHCRPALNALRFRLETDEAEPISRECAMVIVSYLCSLIDHKSCRCLLKNVEAYFAMHQVILDLIELCSSLIATLNEDLISFVEMEGGSVATSATIKREEGSEECSLSCDESDGMDLDESLIPPLSGEVKGFTLDDRRELFHLLAFLLTDQYQFYGLYHKYHGNVPDARLTHERELYAAGYFDTSGFSPLYVLTLAAVRETSLLDRIRECFENAKPGIMPPQFASKMIPVLSTLKRLSNEHVISSKIHPARDASMKFICDLAEEQSETLRDPAMRNCAEQLWLASRECLEECGSIDGLGLSLIIKHFNSPYLAPRLTALTQLNMYISVCSELTPSTLFNPEEASEIIAQYLTDHKVLQLLFGPNSHAELLKQCPNLLNFMALYRRISKEDLDCIWSAGQMKHCSRQVFDLLMLIIKGLDPQLILHLYALLKALKPNEHNEMTLQLASYVTKMIWSYAMCKSTFTNMIPNQQILPRLHQPSGDRSPANIVVWGVQNPQLSPDKAASAKLNARLDVSSGDSTQASTTGEGGGADSLCEEALEGESGSKKPEEGDGRAQKDSPPPLIESATDGKSPGKRAQMHEENESDDQPLAWRQPMHKRQRVLVQRAHDSENIPKAERQPLNVKVQEVVVDNSPGDSSTTTTESSSSEVDAHNLTGPTDEAGGSSSSEDQSLEETQENRETVQRLMSFRQGPRLPSPTDRPRRIVVGRGVAGYHWPHTPESTSLLMETLVKQKDLGNQRMYNDSESDMSSDAATSSDRLNDLDEDEELAVVEAESLEETKLLSYLEHNPQFRRPPHSSPMTLEDEMDEEEDQTNSSLDPIVHMDGTLASSPPQVGAGEPLSSKRNASQLAQTQFLRHQLAAQLELQSQFQNHSRQILTQLAPHAKSFWQGGKYLLLSESELAMFELGFVCNPGHTLLWDLAVEDGNGSHNPPDVVEPLGNEQQQPNLHQHTNDRLPPELQAYALQMLEDVVAWAPNMFIKKVFVRGCVERLRNHKSVPVVLSLLRKILASFRPTWRTPAAAIAAHHFRHSGSSGSGEDLNAVVWADQELDLLAAFFDDLANFRSNPPAGDEARFSVEQELRARVEFLEYIFSSQGTPNNYQIASHQLDILWDCLSIDACGCELLYKWLLDQLKSQSQHALNMDLLNYVLVSKVVSCKPEILSPAGLSFLQAVLQESNVRSSGSSGETAITVCLPLIWSAALRNVDPNVTMAAMTFISNYYVHTGGSAQKEIQFIEHCMNHVRFACENMSDTQLTTSLMCIQRAIVILRSHIDAFRRRHAFNLRMWELEGRGVKSHMQCVPHAALIDAIPIIRVTLQAPGIEKKAMIEISTTDLLGHLRAEVTFWWKNANKLPAMPPLLFGRQAGITARKAASTPSFIQDLPDSSSNTPPQDPGPSTSSALTSVTRPIGITAPMNVVVYSATESSFVPFTPELRAPNITIQEEPPHEATGQNGMQNPILGALLSNNRNEQQRVDGGPLRLLCQGRELTVDLDEKSVLDIGLRDGSIIHVQSGGSQSGVKLGHQYHGTLSHGVIRDLSPGQIGPVRDKNAQAAPPPDPASMPMALLSTPANWQLLMNLIKLLIEKASMETPDLATKCRTWSYRAWEVIQLLPTYPPCVEGLTLVLDSDLPEAASVGEVEMQQHWKTLFDSNGLHRFLYSMQCLEMLAQKSNEFVALGGLKHLINVFMERSLFPKSNGDWSEWEVECATSILRIVYKFSIETESLSESSSGAPPGFRVVPTRSIKSASFDMLVPTLQMKKFEGIDKKKLIDTVMDLIGEYCMDRPFFHMCGPISRLRGLQTAFQLLIAILLNDLELRKGFQFGSDDNGWLKRILLDCQDPNLRREVSGSLYRLCRGRTKANAFNGQLLTPRLTVRLLSLLKDAKDIVPLANAAEDTSETDQKAQQRSISSSSNIDFDFVGASTPNNAVAVISGGVTDFKEPHGASPSSYFWLLTHLLESLLLHDGEFSTQTNAQNKDSQNAERELATAEFSVDFDTVAAEIAQYLTERPFYESKHAPKIKAPEQIRINQRRCDHEQQYQLTDPGLVGLLQTAVAIIKFNPIWKFSPDGQNFVQTVFDLIFSLPMPKNGRHHPKCQSGQSRIAAYDLLVEMAKGCDENFMLLYKKLLFQNSKDSHETYGWEYWPQDERRAPCGYVGLMNLGATCYMASAMQQLYMIPRFRVALLNARVVESTKHEAAFREMQRMFAFLLESERKAYNPRAFCKAYQMNHQPLNITEQKDMAEFFTDLITKLEEMSPDLKRVVKNLFCGVMSNNVVSMDCPHVSKTVEDFYTVRCQVADMKDLHESLSELTIGDMLEGDNMYTCSQCNKKVRAEKRACFQKLPRILCFNTMRYTFNMITMMKEKVNTHFSFPFRLNMSPFMEENLLPSHASGDETNDSTAWTMRSNSRGNEYELIGVTVHTGTADGGHYYSFIRDRTTPVDPNEPRDPEADRWYSFNDADVRSWDPAQLAAECFGGELTRQQYDSVAEKYLDLSFEKTNSAYLLLYERVPAPSKARSPDAKASTSTAADTNTVVSKPSRLAVPSKAYEIDLPEDVERWICEDNVRFIQDLTFFDHAYFHFIWQICTQVPATLAERDPSEITFLSAKLSLCFVLETLLHAKEKATISQWMEVLLKDMSASPRACEWFLNRMAKTGDWPAEILMGPSKSCREVFQKLCIHAITELYMKHEQLCLLPWTPDKSDLPFDAFDPDEIGNQSCVGKFIKRLLSLLHTQHANVETRQLNEFFGLLLEFARNRPGAITFLHLISAIHHICTFYMKRSNQDVVEVESEDEVSEDEMIPRNLMSLVTACGMRMQSSIWSPSVLERLLKLVTLLLEKGAGLQLRQKDLQAVIGGKNFAFLMQMIRDVGNPNVSGPLVLSVANGTPGIGKRIIDTIFDYLKRLKEDTDQYFNLLSYFVDMAEKFMSFSSTESAEAGSSSSPPAAAPSITPTLPYVILTLERMWELAESRQCSALKWLERNVTNHRSILFETLINGMDRWVERFLLKEANSHARIAAGELLLSLIPSPTVRASFSQIGKGLNLSSRAAISSEAASVLHRVYEHLLWLLRHRASHYVIPDHQSTQRLVQFFQTMKACLVSKDEKLMTVPYISDIWGLFHGHMMEKPVKINANKQALLTFWYMACVDCPEMILGSLKHPNLQKFYMYNFIHVADDDEDLTNSNKVMLTAFYGLMRLFCMYSPSFCDLILQHENTIFACQSVATKDAYKDAREEIFGAIETCCKQPGIKPQTQLDFKQRIWSLFLTAVAKSRANFPLLLRFLKIATDTPQDKVLLLHNHVLPICADAFCTLHKMHHEASGCNVLGELSEMLKRFYDILKFATKYVATSAATSAIPPKLGSPLSGQSQSTAAGASAESQAEEEFGKETREIVAKAVREWTNMTVVLHRLLELLNSYIPPEIRRLSIDCIKEIVLLNEAESLVAILPEIKRIHSHCRAASTIATSVGPYFPKRGQTTNTLTPFRRIHPPRPMFNMCLQPTQLEASKGFDPTYDQMLIDYFQPYHQLVDRLLRTAFNLGPEIILPQLLVEVSCLLGCEGVPLHFAFFPKLWLDLWKVFREGKDLQKQIDCLCGCFLLKEFIETVLVQEQHSLANSQIFTFIQIFIDRCQEPIPPEKILIAIDNGMAALADTNKGVESIVQAFETPAALTTAGTISRELERLPISFGRMRGAFRALSLIYLPTKLPQSWDKDDLRKRFIEQWTKLKTLCEAATALSSTNAMDVEEQQELPSSSGSIDHFEQYRYGVAAKVRQHYSEFSQDSAEAIGVLLARLDIPEMPVDATKDDEVANEAGSEAKPL